MAIAVQKNIRALVALARIIGRKHGLTVVFDPQVKTAATDGKTVRLPVISTLGTEAHAVLIEGLLDHEAMHCHLTDFTVIAGLQGPALLHTLHNVFEDVWGEREQAKTYPGCARNIRLSMVEMIKLGWYGPPTANQHPASATVNFLLMGLLARWYLLDDLTGFAEEHRREAVRVLGPHVVEKLWETALTVDSVTSTDQALKLARKILVIIQEEQRAQRKQEEREKQERDELCEAAGEPNQQQGSTSPTNTHAQADVDEGTVVPSPAATLQAILDAGKAEIGAAEMAERILEALSSAGKAGENADNTFHALATGDRPGAGLLSEVPPISDDVHCKIEDAAWQIARPISVRLGTKLESLLEARTENVVYMRRHGNRMASAKVSGLRFGKTNVFYGREEGDGLDTAVLVLLDTSGSMLGNFLGNLPTRDVVPIDTRMASAVGVVLAASEAMSKHEIPFGVFAFGSSFSKIKPFEKEWSRCRRNKLSTQLGGTATDLAVLRLADTLVTRTEKRKIVVLVTDGEPNSPGLAIAAMNEIRRDGIEFAVILIGKDCGTFQDELTSNGYKSSRVADPTQLAAAFFNAVENAF